MKAATTRVPPTNHARNLAKRFREHGDEEAGRASRKNMVGEVLLTGGLLMHRDFLSASKSVLYCRVDANE